MGGKSTRPVFRRSVQNKSCNGTLNGVRKPAGSTESLANLDNLVHSAAAAERHLNITVNYEDVRTQQWAGDICAMVKSRAGSHPVRPMWWKLDNLVEPGVLAGAVSTALRADIMKERKFSGEVPVNVLTGQASRAFSRLNRLILGHEPVSRLFS